MPPDKVASSPDLSGAAALPLEIAFLAATPEDAGPLERIAREARACGVTADVALIAGGHCNAETFYRRLAHGLGVPFLDGYHALAPSCDPGLALQAGVAPLAANPLGIGYAMAPRGAQLRDLLLRMRDARADVSEFAVATPAHFARMVMVSCRGALADFASGHLAASAPALCAKTGGTNRQKGLALLAAALAASLAALAPAAAVALAMSLLAFIFLSAVALRLEAVVADDGLARDFAAPSLADADLPAYTVVAPLYREANVVAQLLGALARLDYPAAKLDIKVVVEWDDAQTIDALAAIALPPCVEVLVAPPGAPRTKPRALNLALPFARGELIVVFDAEDRPDPGQLRLAAELFAAGLPGLACLQARLCIENSADSWLTRLFALEYGALFDVVNPGFGILGLPFPLGGTSNHFRLDALRAIGGWDAWNVTEDADLGIRIARHGLRIDTFASTTHEEAPAQVKAWLAQRRRWFKGWMQTLVVHTRHPAALVSELGLAPAAAILVTLVSTIASALLGPSLLVLLLHQSLFGGLFRPANPVDHVIMGFALTVAFAGLASAIWPAWRAARLRGREHLLPWLALLPAYYALMTVAAWVALFDLWRNPFSWSKTEHGLARSNDPAPLRASEL